MKSTFKMLTVAVAGSCLLCFTPALSMAQDALAVVTSAPVTAVPIHEVPLVSAQAVTITSKLIEENTDLIDAELTLPVISGMADTGYQDEWNARIEKQARDTLATLKKEASDYYADAEKYGYPAHPYEMIVIYDLKSDGSSAAGGVLSLTVSTYTYTGGAHGGTFEATYNIANAPDASALTLEQALGDGGIASANRAVRYSFQQNPDTYFPDAMSTFDGVSPDQTFYIEQGIVYLVYQQYDLAPYAGGIIYIPVDKTTTVGPSIKLSRYELTAGGKDSHYVPLRKTAEALGYHVTWIKSTRSAELSRDAQWTSVSVDKNSYILNRMAPIKLLAAPKLINSTLYVPDEFFERILNLDITGNTKDGSLTITG